MSAQVIDRWYEDLNVMFDVTHITARAIIGTCRECGRDIVGAHESMKCQGCRTYREEWKNVD